MAYFNPLESSSNKFPQISPHTPKPLTIQEKLARILTNSKVVTTPQAITLLDPPNFLLENPKHKMLETFNFPKEKLFSPRNCAKFSSSQINFKNPSFHRENLKELAKWADFEIDKIEGLSSKKPTNHNTSYYLANKGPDKNSNTSFKNCENQNKTYNIGQKNSFYINNQSRNQIKTTNKSQADPGLLLHKLQIYKTLVFKLIDEVKKQSKTQGFLLEKLWDDLFKSIKEGFEACELEALALEKALLDQISRLHEIYQKKLMNLSQEMRDLQENFEKEKERTSKLVLKNLYLKKISGKGKLVQGHMKERLEELQETNQRLYKENLNITMAVSDLDSEIFQTLNKKYMENIRNSLQEMISDKTFAAKLSTEKLARLKKLAENIEKSGGISLDHNPGMTNLTDVLKKSLLEEDTMDNYDEDEDDIEILFCDKGVETYGIIDYFTQGVDTMDLTETRSLMIQCELSKKNEENNDKGVLCKVEMIDHEAQCDLLYEELNKTDETFNKSPKRDLTNLRMMKRVSSPNPSERRKYQSKTKGEMNKLLLERKEESYSPREKRKISPREPFSPRSQKGKLQKSNDFSGKDNLMEEFEEGKGNFEEMLTKSRREVSMFKMRFQNLQESSSSKLYERKREENLENSKSSLIPWQKNKQKNKKDKELDKIASESPKKSRNKGKSYEKLTIEIIENEDKLIQNVDSNEFLEENLIRYEGEIENPIEIINEPRENEILRENSDFYEKLKKKRDDLHKIQSHSLVEVLGEKSGKKQEKSNKIKTKSPLKSFDEQISLIEKKPFSRELIRIFDNNIQKNIHSDGELRFSKSINSNFSQKTLKNNLNLEKNVTSLDLSAPSSFSKTNEKKIHIYDKSPAILEGKHYDMMGENGKQEENFDKNDEMIDKEDEKSNKKVKDIEENNDKIEGNHENIEINYIISEKSNKKDENMKENNEKIEKNHENIEVNYIKNSPCLENNKKIIKEQLKPVKTYNKKNMLSEKIETQPIEKTINEEKPSEIIKVTPSQMTKLTISENNYSDQKKMKKFEKKHQNSIIFKDFEPNFQYSSKNISFYKEMIHNNTKNFEKLVCRVKDKACLNETIPDLAETLTKFNEINIKIIRNLFSSLSKPLNSQENHNKILEDVREQPKLAIPTDKIYKNNNNPMQKMTNTIANHFNLINPRNSESSLPNEDSMIKDSKKPTPRLLKAYSQHLTVLVPFPRMNRRATLEDTLMNSLENIEKSPGVQKTRALENAQHLIQVKFMKEKGLKKGSLLSPMIVFKLISMIYSEAMKKVKKGEKLEEFVLIFYEFFVKRYGLKNIAEAKMFQVLHSCYVSDLKDNLKIMALKGFLGLEKNDGMGGYENYLKNIINLDESIKRGGFNINIERISTEYERALKVFEEKFEGKIGEKEYGKSLKEIERMAKNDDKFFIDKVLKIMGKLEEMQEK